MRLFWIAEAADAERRVLRFRRMLFVVHGDRGPYFFSSARLCLHRIETQVRRAEAPTNIGPRPDKARGAHLIRCTCL